MPPTIGLPEQWKRCRQFYEDGEGTLKEAARGAGLNYSTVRHWAIRDEWVRPDGAGPSSTLEKRQEVVLKLKAENERMLEARRMELADRLFDQANDLLDRAFEATVYKEVKVLPQGRDAGSIAEIVEVDLPAPTATDVRNLAIAFGIFVDKAQLLSGEATDRSEIARTPEERRARMSQIRDELAARRGVQTEGVADVG